MPLITRISSDSEIDLCIWKVVEPTSYFESKLDIHDPEQSIISSLSSRKKQEWMASRYLLHLMSGRSDRAKFEKDIHGKPHLVDSDYHISISHSNGYIAVIASPKTVGVDIQTYVQKISRIQHKFVSTIENEYLGTDPIEQIKALHILWGAKESLYKAYGLKALDFKKHIFIENLDSSDSEGSFSGLIVKESYRQEFDLHYHSTEQFILVYAKISH